MSEKKTISLTVSSVSMMSCLFLFGLLLEFSQAQQLPPEVVRYAEMVLYNGHVLTMDRDRPPINVVQAVALRDSRIMAVGEDDRILKMAGPNTVKVDLNGKTVIPGVIDTHSHPNRYALTHYATEVTPPYLRFLQENHVRYVTLEWETKEIMLADFKRAVDRVPPGDWIFTRTGHSEAAAEVNRYDLDKLSPDNPTFIKVGNAWFGAVNTKMLDMLLDIYGEKLPGVLRDEQGVPTGRLFGAASTVMDQEMIPPMPPEIMAPAFKKELEEWVALGVTTLSTRLRGHEILAHDLLDQKGELPLRLPYSHELGRWNPFFDRDLKRFGIPMGHGTDRLWLIGISVGIPDGNGPGAGGDSCTTLKKREILPNDLFPDGMCYWEQPDDPSMETVLAAIRHGYRITGTHTFGDKGFLMLLDAFEQANQENPTLGRGSGLDHGMMVSPEVVKKSAELGVIWSLQPQLFSGRYPGAVSRVFGEEYAHRWVMPVKSLIDAGARVTYGADVHSDPQRAPMFGLEVLVTRKTSDGRVFGARESIDRSTALLMLTRWGAEYVLREKELGSLEVGKLADLAVLDRNPLDRNVSDEALSDIKVLATIIGGKVVYGSLLDR